MATLTEAVTTESSETSVSVVAHMHYQDGGIILDNSLMPVIYQVPIATSDIVASIDIIDITQRMEVIEL